MKVRIVRQPTGSVEGISLHFYHPGNVYDLPASIAEYLVAEGFALIEMRTEHQPPSDVPDRRQKPK